MLEQTLILIEENRHFVLGLLHEMEEFPEFSKSQNRYMLQGVVGIVDELSELLDVDNHETTKKVSEYGRSNLVLEELGDVLFYVTLLYHSLTMYDKIEIGEKTKEKIKRFASTLSQRSIDTNDTKYLLSCCKKVIFQGRSDLFLELIRQFTTFLVFLEKVYTPEGISLAFSTMKAKLKKRYPDGFSPEASRTRKC